MEIRTAHGGSMGVCLSAGTKSLFPWGNAKCQNGQRWGKWIKNRLKWVPILLIHGASLICLEMSVNGQQIDIHPTTLV